MSKLAQVTPDKQQTGPLTRFLQRSFRLGVTLCFIGMAAAAVYVGASELSRRAEAVPAPDAAPVVTVSASPLMRQSGYEIQRVFIGQVEAQRSVDISFELGGKLEQILVDEGDIVSQGQLLANLDISLLEAEEVRLTASRDAVKAQLGFAQKTVARNSELSERGFTSQARLDEAIARQDELHSRMGELDAALNELALRIEKSSIEAPFAGRIAERRVDGGETLRSGEAVLSVVETATPRIRIGVPLDVNPSLFEQAQIEIGGKSYSASLASLRPDIDPLTRTRTALFDLAETADVAFGQTARLRVSEAVEATGTWVPTTALKEGARGQWTLLVADAQNLVRTATVEVLHADDDRVFVRGVFPHGTVLINQGPQRITVGQRVALKEAE